MRVIRLTLRQIAQVAYLDPEARAVYDRCRQTGAGHAEALIVARDDIALRYSREQRALRRAA